LSPVPSSTIVSFPAGLTAPARIELSGASPFGERGPTPFSVDWVDAEGNIPFHFNPRPEQQVVVLNSLVGGSWQKEQRVRRYPFRLEPDVPFLLGFDVSPKRFAVSVDGSELCTFKHRRPPTDVVEVRSTAFLWRLDGAGTAHAPEAGARPRGSGGAWVRSEENPRGAEPLDSFRLFAILSTFLEEDVVAATVANCLRQGCERVYLVDNASPDATVERAVAAGATLARSFASERYDEAERVAHMQAVVDEVSEGQEADHVWWLWLDADEFHHGPRGLTIREYLATLDRRFRVVGARFFNHLPDREPAYADGKHPLDCQPLCYEIPVPNCDAGHSNHPLQRWSRGAPRITAGLGAHHAVCAEPLLEPAEGVFFHHFPYRDEAVTRRRLLRLFGRNGDAGDRIGDDPNHAHLALRLRSLDAVYRQRWHDVAFFPPCARGYVPELRGWDDWVPPEDRPVARWY
jgi:hypothetical protein